MAGGLSSRKGFTRDNDLTSSSVDQVLYNNDLLMDILLRLPVLQLYRFKPVCKQWLSLITSPTFTSTRTRIAPVDPPSGLFTLRSSDCRSKKRKKNLDPLIGYGFLSFVPRVPAKRFLTFNLKEAAIKRSCNGLLLCYSIYDFKYYVCNPSTNMAKMLTPNHNVYYNDNMHLAFDPNKSHHYKVVHVGVGSLLDNSIRIQTYSSETDVWSVCDVRFSATSFYGFCDGIYWNGAIHWLEYSGPSHFKLDIVDRPVLTIIQPPNPVTADEEGPPDRKLFMSSGSLLLVCKYYAYSQLLKIYKMQTGSSEWSVTFSVNIDERPFPTLRMPLNWDCHYILSIDEDPSMVIEFSGKMFQYKFMSQTISKLKDLRNEDFVFGCHEFIASFAHI